MIVLVRRREVGVVLSALLCALPNGVDKMDVDRACRAAVACYANPDVIVEWRVVVVLSAALSTLLR